MQYDDFTMQELRDMEYISIKLNEAEKKNYFEIWFKGLGKLAEKVVKAFSKR